MISRKVLIIFLFLVFLIAVIFFKEPHSNVDRTLEKMSQQERLALSDLFRGLIEDDCFGYTLFGNKPVTVESYFIKTPLSILDFLRDRNSYMIHKGQKAWIKYKNSFESKKFFLKFEVDEDDASVYLINKAAFLCCVADNLDIFHNLLGANVTPEGLLEKFIQNGMGFNNVVNNSSILEGLLLGYGKHNALLYKRSSEISVALKSSVPPPWKEKRDLGKEQLSMEKKLHIYINETKKINPAEGNLKVVPREGFPNLVEEYEWLDAKFDKGADLSPFRDLSRFPFPNFLKDGENEESVQIINDYIDTKKKMGEIYASGDFLTITLKKIMGEI